MYYIELINQFGEEKFTPSWLSHQSADQYDQKEPFLISGAQLQRLLLILVFQKT